MGITTFYRTKLIVVVYSTKESCSRNACFVPKKTATSPLVQKMVKNKHYHQVSSANNMLRIFFHCSFVNSTFLIRVGDHNNTEKDIDEEEFEMEKIIMHEEYDCEY
jgi:hypothetical protein